MSIEAHIQEVQAAYTHIRLAAHQAQESYDHYLDALNAHYQQRLNEIEQSFQRARTEAETAYQAAIAQAQQMGVQTSDQIREHLAAPVSAFPWIVSPWDDPAWETYTPFPDAPIPSVVRIGRLDVPDAAILGDSPALLPLVGQGHIFLESSDADLAHRMFQTILLRLVVSFPPGTLRLVLTDPTGAGSTLAAFLRLPPTLRGSEVHARAEEIDHQLLELEQHIKDVSQTRLLNVYDTIESYNAAHPETAVAYRVLALTDFPAAFHERMVERLLTIARNGPRAGVYVVASLNRAYQPARPVNLEPLTSLGSMLTLVAPNRVQWRDPEFGRYPVLPDALPAPERVNRWLQTVGDAIPSDSVVPFRRIAIPEAARWKNTSTDGLTIPIGINRTGQVHAIRLGVGVTHHGLIGGMVGSGKSNLLHVIINQIALSYAPEEVELYLLDFREGVGFQPYTTLPHARVVALESEREFAVSVLKHVQDEMKARGELFKGVPGYSVETLPEYRRQTGTLLPRKVVMMDEFQVLFREEDRLAQDAARILEDLARRGRGFGIHLLLCSQSPTMAGMHGTRIYNQMELRIALRCKEQDSQAILGTAAANMLEQPGDAIDTTEAQTIRVASLSVEERRACLQTITARAQGTHYPSPVTFEARVPAKLEDNTELQSLLVQPGWSPRTPTVQVWLGQPVEIKPVTVATIERYLRSNLLIAGGNDAEAYGVLVATLVSIAAQRSPTDARFVIADFARPGTPFGGFLERLTQELPHPVDIAGERQIAPLLTHLAETVAERHSTASMDVPDIYFIVAGMHRWRDLRARDYKPADAGQKLAQVIEDGPDVGMHVIAWVDSLVTLDNARLKGSLGAFDLRVALRLSEKDSSDLLNSPIAARMEDNRAVFRHEDRAVGEWEKFKPYAVPEEAVLHRLIAQIWAKG